MDGIHDLGGRHGFGESLAQRDEECFHTDWEARVFAMTSLLLVKGCFNVDEFRHAIERTDPAAYLRDGYYARWLAGVELLVREAGGRPAAGEVDASRGAARELDQAPRFSVGDAVRTRNLHRPGHIRLPGYARGHRGSIEMLHGGWVLPDANAHHEGDRPEHVYAVRFSGKELWGEAAEPATSVCVDLFESYLESDRERDLESQLESDQESA